MMGQGESGSDLRLISRRALRESPRRKGRKIGGG